jgi:Protein of unknown function (DUF3987)
MKKAPLVGAARDASSEKVLELTSAPFRVAAPPDVAEEVATRSDIPDAGKVRILLAIIRSLTAVPPIESVDDVDRLMLRDPDGFERLLRSYRGLLGNAVVDVSDAIERAERGQRPHGYAADDTTFGATYLKAIGEVRAERERRDARRSTYDRWPRHCSLRAASANARGPLMRDAFDEQLAALEFRDAIRQKAAAIDWQDAYPWPEPMHAEAFYGAAGAFVCMVQPHTEADAHALLANFLSGVSAMIGANPHTLGVRRQPAKVNVLIVGDTGDARKGTAFEDVDWFLRIADGTTLDAILAPGVTSGEGLIRFLRTPTYVDDETGIETPRLKRAWAREGEYTRLSAVARRDGSTLSQCLRDAFDSTTLANLTKRDPDRVRGAHVAISADVTKVDLVYDTPDVKIANGVVNRFAIICARRVKLLPRGGTLTDADLAPLAKRLNSALRAARERCGTPLSEAALKRWDVFYESYEAQELPPLLHAATRRGPQYVLRIALIHALLDEAAEIGIAHLEAAIAFWEYAFASAQHVFAAKVGHPKADELLHYLRDVYPNTLTGGLVDEFCGKHLRPNERRGVRDELLRLNLITIEKQHTGERGRPIEHWQAKPPAPRNGAQYADKCGINSKTGISPYFSAPPPKNGRAVQVQPKHGLTHRMSRRCRRRRIRDRALLAKLRAFVTAKRWLPSGAELAGWLGRERTTTWRSLNRLRGAGLVQTERRGAWEVTTLGWELLRLPPVRAFIVRKPRDRKRRRLAVKHAVIVRCAAAHFAFAVPTWRAALVEEGLPVYD